jgi:hypothetical protein
MSAPNFRKGVCCYSCKHGESDIRRGCYMGYFCNKHNIETSETNLCDNYDSLKKSKVL